MVLLGAVYDYFLMASLLADGAGIYKQLQVLIVYRWIMSMTVLCDFYVLKRHRSHCVKGLKGCIFLFVFFELAKSGRCR